MTKRYRLDHLELRGQQWYARLNVPPGARATIGRRKFRQALNTADRTVAQQRAARLVAAWREAISLAKGGPRAADDAAWWKRALRAAAASGGADLEGTTDLMVEAAEEPLKLAAMRRGISDHRDPRFEALPEYAAAQSVIAVASGKNAPTNEALDEWIGSLQTKAKTSSQRRQTIERLAVKFPTLRDITRKAIVRWVAELRAELSGATVQRLMSDCRAYWTYLASIEAVPEDSSPFERLGLKVKNQSWLHYEPEEAVRILGAAEGELADLIRLAMYSGCRREELCALRVEHVKHDRFEIVDAKTEAGVRTVPVHPELRLTLKRLIGTRTEGFVLAGLGMNRNGDRGDAIGKRFSKLKASLGFSERHSFHSWRGTVITLLERAGVPEGTTQDIVGHERSTLTGATYSGKSTFEMRKEALAKLRYPTTAAARGKRPARIKRGAATA